MTDETVECEYCEDEFKSQGFAAHQRFCDEKPDDDDDVQDDWTEIEAAVLERDDEQCLNCDGGTNLTIHVVDPDERDRVGNRLTLCGDCDDEFDELHPLTKRTQAWH